MTFHDLSNLFIFVRSYRSLHMNDGVGKVIKSIKPTINVNCGTIMSITFVENNGKVNTIERGNSESFYNECLQFVNS